MKVTQNNIEKLQNRYINNRQSKVKSVRKDEQNQVYLDSKYYEVNIIDIIDDNNVKIKQK